ncbi:Mu-like prophage FluMu protein gp41 [Rhizobium sp. CF080]|uniref:phage tail assembly protein n=1 Tax=Rhizobium sp. (strain CF080) TaxID=1144310 RepID=UPI000271777B|nr:phage tail assembly protein [Rhizobium sp. CF080]EUB97314.1 Mu-like prophage FluMu protein gp41 [Rhizobium sp. CF080]
MVDQVTRAMSQQEMDRVLERKAKEVVVGAVASMAPPVFVEGAVRHISVPLDYPVTFNGGTISEVVIRRPTMREWRAYLRECVDAVKERGPGADDDVDQVWLSVPAVVLENLDFIDASRVESAQEGFFERTKSSPETETADSSSSTSDTGEPSPSS